MEVKEGACTVLEKPKRLNTGLVRPCPALRSLLEKVGATAQVYTKFEVIEHLKVYIKDKKLVDPDNPTKIICENDILEKVFGCKEFLTENVCELLHHSLESVSDTSDAELGLITFDNKQTTRKRKRTNLTDVSCSSYSSGAGSPINIRGFLGFLGRNGSESTDDYSDGSVALCLGGKHGYHTATTAVVSDTEDEIDFPNDVTDLDTFSVEYEPPETDDEKDDDESDEEPVIEISSDDEEDPGALGGDEYDVDDHSDSEDSWECAECWTMNHPMTTKCVRCWKGRVNLCQKFPTSFRRSMSAPEPTTSKDTTFQFPVVPSLHRYKTDFPSVIIHEDKSASNTVDDNGACVFGSTNFTTEPLSKIIVSLSRSSSSCSSTVHTSCDSGVCVSSCETDTERISTDTLTKKECADTSVVSTSMVKPLTTYTEDINHGHMAEITKNLAHKISDNQSSELHDNALLSELWDKKETASNSVSSELQNNTVSPIKNIPHELKNMNGLSTVLSDSKVVNLCPESSESHIEDVETLSLVESKDETPPVERTLSERLCVICTSEPRNASIIHGRSGHQVCCIACAEKLKANKKKCPVCRRKIQIVIKNFL